MMMYLNSFWNAGFWSGLLIGVVGISFRLGSLHVEPFLALLAWLGVWLAILLFTRSRLVTSDMTAAAILKPAMAPGPSEMPEKENQDRPRQYLRAGLARTLAFAPLTANSGADTNDLVSDLQGAVESINLWYWPVQAVVWVIPAVGFIGSAWQMRLLMYLTLEQGARNRALEIETLMSMAPVLVDGLTIICVALALSAITHVATSLVFRRDLLSVTMLRTALSSHGASPDGSPVRPRSEWMRPRPIKERS
jgi:hypothetical protein